jgi:hypothetical protein
MPERAFSASYDSTTQAVSVVACALLMVVAWLIHVVFIALLPPLLIFLAYAYSARGYLMSADAIVVKRLIGNIRVPRRAFERSAWEPRMISPVASGCGSAAAYSVTTAYTGPASWGNVIGT